MSNNNVKDWGEFQKLAELPCLEVLLFVGMLKPNCFTSQYSLLYLPHSVNSATLEVCMYVTLH